MSGFCCESACKGACEREFLENLNLPKKAFFSRQNLPSKSDNFSSILVFSKSKKKKDSPSPSLLKVVPLFLKCEREGEQPSTKNNSRKEVTVGPLC